MSDQPTSEAFPYGAYNMSPYSYQEPSRIDAVGNSKPEPLPPLPPKPEPEPDPSLLELIIKSKRYDNFPPAWEIGT